MTPQTILEHAADNGIVSLSGRNAFELTDNGYKPVMVLQCALETVLLQTFEGKTETFAVRTDPPAHFYLEPLDGVYLEFCADAGDYPDFI